MKQFKFIDEACECGLDLTTLHPERTRDEGAGVCPNCGRTLLVTDVGEEGEAGETGEGEAKGEEGEEKELGKEGTSEAEAEPEAEATEPES